MSEKITVPLKWQYREDMLENGKVEFEMTKDALSIRILDKDSLIKKDFTIEVKYLFKIADFFKETL